MTTVLGLVNNQRDVRELVGRLRAGLHHKRKHKRRWSTPSPTPKVKTERAYPDQGEVGDTQADLTGLERLGDGDLEVLVGRLLRGLAVELRLVRAGVDDVAEHLADVGRRALGGALGAAAGPEADRDTDFRRPSEGVLCAYSEPVSEDVM